MLYVQVIIAVIYLLIVILLLLGVQYKLLWHPPLTGIVYLLHFRCKLVAHATYKHNKDTGVLGAKLNIQNNQIAFHKSISIFIN